MTKHPFLQRHHTRPVAAWLAVAALVATAILAITQDTTGADEPGLIPPLVIVRCDQHAGTGECPAVPVPGAPEFAG